jgi:amino acid transporter
MYISVTIASAFVLLSLGIYANLLFGTSFDARIAAVVGALVLAAVNLRSVAEAGRAEIVLVALKVAILAGLTAIGIARVTPADFAPLFPYGTSGMFSGVAMVFFAYIGFQVVAMMGGEIKSSERSVPVATLLSIGIVILIYAGVEIALLSAHLPAYGETSLFDAAVVFFGSWGGAIVAAGAIFSTLSAANANLIGGSRVALEMASERQIPGWFAMLRNDQPRNAILLSTVITLALIAFGTLGVIVDLTNAVTLVAMGMVNVSAAVFALRCETIPENRRYFRLPFGPLIPVAGAISCALMLLTLPATTLLAGLAALAAGTALYVLEDSPEGERAVAEIRALLGRGER